VYDLSGVSPSPIDPKEEGIRRFKSKFGGKYVEYAIYSKIYSRTKDKLVRWLKRGVK
jgi:lipid II:glycine glycyltransferase (peptidoglycan interpeptide bridge formation enzyme)